MKTSTAVEVSGNGKIGEMSATYASPHSCPATCPLRDKGCYGTYGYTRLAWARVSAKASPLEMAKEEARQIEGLSGRNNLRVHVLGDSKTNSAARVIADAAKRYMAKFGKRAYTYTHAWKRVKRESWGAVSVLASCETVADVKIARAAGYATALVVGEFAQDTAYSIDGVKIVPCPQQTGRAKSCNDCRLCMNDGKLRDIGVTIAFAAHGVGKKTIKNTLEALK